MKIILKRAKILAVFLMAIAITGCSNDDDNNTVTTTTVVDVAVANGFTSLAAALQATNLVTTLEGDGPFTVFAPTNEAFTTLLNATGLDLNNLSTDEEELVRQILLNHVIVGTEVPSTDITTAGIYANVAADGPNSTSLSIYARNNGGIVEINGGDGTTAAPRNGADVISPDVPADNGVIHVVNEVIMLPTIADMALANPALSNLVAALQLADTAMMPTVNWINTVSGEENENLAPYTVFAPTNTAFDNLLIELDPTGNTELADLAPATVDAVLTFHVVASSNVQSTQLGSLNGTIPTLGGDLSLDGLIITDSNNRDSNILAPDLVNIQTSNGVVHAIDTVILPPQ